MFIDELRRHINSQIQVATPGQVLAGVLAAVNAEVITLRTSTFPGYDGAEDVMIRIENIGYVRVFE
ncbi:hypothetical protein [Ammoniphilus oxalaticus]|nr:hypothetical protein [Ammoniphilus oxalaticus]